MTDRPIRVLLDASAIIAFTRGTTIGVGEIIAEIDDEGAAFGVPVACLAVAHTEVRDQGLLDMLLTHPACVLLVDRPTGWRRVATILATVDSYDVASAVALAYALNVEILTRRAGLYVKLPNGGPIIEV